jgi:CRP-like cAMP-binding protein
VLLERALELVAGNRVFRNVYQEHLAAIGQYGRQRHFPRDCILIGKGEYGDCLYLILEGAVKVEHEAIGSPPELSATLGPGEFLGEIGLLTWASRSATVTALQDVQALELTMDDLRQVFRHDRGLILSFVRLVRQRLRSG